jgi:hypothetical protein
VLVKEFRTEGLSVTERFGSWHDMTVSALISSVVRSDHGADFRASARSGQLTRHGAASDMRAHIPAGTVKPLAMNTSTHRRINQLRSTT